MRLPGDDQFESSDKLSILKLFRGFGVVITVLLLAVAWFTISARQGLYSAEQPGETKVVAPVERLGYGFTAGKTTEKAPLEFDGQSCFVKLQDEPQEMQYSASVCYDLKKGQEVTAYSNGLRLRLDATSIPTSSRGTAVASIFPLAFAALAAVGTWIAHRKVRRFWDDALKQLLTERQS